jgi:hypothetical protein
MTTVQPASPKGQFNKNRKPSKSDGAKPSFVPQEPPAYGAEGASTLEAQRSHLDIIKHPIMSKPMTEDTESNFVTGFHRSLAEYDKKDMLKFLTHSLEMTGSTDIGGKKVEHEGAQNAKMSQFMQEMLTLYKEQSGDYRVREKVQMMIQAYDQDTSRIQAQDNLFNSKASNSISTAAFERETATIAAGLERQITTGLEMNGETSFELGWKSIITDGGNIGGHSIRGRMIDNKDGTVDLVIYNGGEGAENHDRTGMMVRAKRFRFDKAMLGTPAFKEACSVWVKMQCQAKDSRQQIFDTYTTVPQLLNAQVINDPVDTFEDMQVGGFCTSENRRAELKALLGPEEYTEFKNFFIKNFVADFFSRFSDSRLRGMVDVRMAELAEKEGSPLISMDSLIDKAKQAIVIRKAEKEDVILRPKEDIEEIDRRKEAVTEEEVQDLVSDLLEELSRKRDGDINDVDDNNRELVNNPFIKQLSQMFEVYFDVIIEESTAGGINIAQFMNIDVDNPSLTPQERAQAIALKNSLMSLQPKTQSISRIVTRIQAK